MQKNTAELLAETFDFKPFKHLLDLGGGSGAYSIAIANKYPNIKATLVDLPPVCKVAVKIIEQADMKDKIDVIEKNLLQDSLLIKGDVILISQVLHNISKVQCMKLIKKAYDVTNSNGMIIINEFILEENKTSPQYSSLFALNMLITTNEGGVYTQIEIVDWLEQAGYSNIQICQTHAKSTFITGLKK